jgi:hypothetical protein
MTQHEIEALKEQIKNELRQEFTRNAEVEKFVPAWEKLKNEIGHHTKHLSGPDQYQVMSAFSTIIRNIYGVNQIRYMEDEQYLEMLPLIRPIFKKFNAS